MGSSKNASATDSIKKSTCSTVLDICAAIRSCPNKRVIFPSKSFSPQPFINTDLQLTRTPLQDKDSPAEVTIVTSQGKFCFRSIQFPQPECLYFPVVYLNILNLRGSDR